MMSITSSSLVGCYGNFTLTRKLYTWNGSLGDKFLVSAVAWVMVIVPIYGFAGFIDFVFLNTVEFWTGKNPMAMKAGEKEIQVVEMNGEQYEITATKNRFDIIKLSNPKAPSVSLIYDEADKSWYAESAQGKAKIAVEDAKNPNFISVIYPDGKTVKLNKTTAEAVAE